MKAFSFLLAVILLICPLSAVVYADGGDDIYPSVAEIEKICDGIVSWKSAELSSGDEDIYSKLTSLCGSTAGDWYAFSLGRLGKLENSQEYIDHLKLYVEQKYALPDKLSSSLSTEWCRIALTALSLGADATNFGKDQSGEAIDLIRDGVYDRGLTEDIGKQGLSGYVWGLIALDSMRYEVPSDAFYTREDLITEILKRQLESGGFDFSGKVADPDMTAMAIVALSTYIGDDTEYEFTNIYTKKQVKTTVREAINSAVELLSLMQTANGGYRSYGVENANSTAQVVLALCTVGVDIFKDERFIKNGEDLFDAMMKYKNTDGGFVYAIGQTSSNSLASVQVLYTLSAIMRFRLGERKLFDLRSEFSDEMKSMISSINERVASSEVLSYDEVYSLLRDYCTVPLCERDYIYFSDKLKKYAEAFSIDLEELDRETEKIGENKDNGDNGDNGNGDDPLPEKVTLSDDEVEFILSTSIDEVTTEHYSRMLIIQKKLKTCDGYEAEEKAKYEEKLAAMISRASEIQTEIKLLNADIASFAHPLEDIDKSSLDLLMSLAERYNALSDYDKQKIEDYEGLNAAYIKAATGERATYIFYAAVGAIAVCTICVALRVFIRIRKKNNERKADEYSEEE